MKADDFAALKQRFSRGARWHSGLLGNQLAISHDSGGLEPTLSVPPLQVALSNGGTVGENCPVYVPPVPPHANVNLAVDRTNDGNFRGLSLVPPVPHGQYWPLLCAMTRSLFTALAEFSATVPPCLDDLSARCINRMGGWTVLKDNGTPTSYPSLSSEFIRLAIELIPYKESGFYMGDCLPVLEGHVSNTTAYRLSWPPRMADSQEPDLDLLR